MGLGAGAKRRVLFRLRTTVSAHCWAEGGARMGSGPRSQMGETDRGSVARLRGERRAGGGGK